MTLPAAIRVNTQVPFPAIVQGSGPIGISKSMGIWTVSLNYSSLGQQAPTGMALNTDMIAVWDSVAQTFFTVPMSYFTTSGTAVKQRSISSPAQAILVASDQQLNLNLSAPQTIILPGYASRNGIPLSFKDVGDQCTNNPVTLQAAAGETIDGFASVIMNVNGMSMNLMPANDGNNTGWFQT